MLRAGISHAPSLNTTIKTRTIDIAPSTRLLAWNAAALADTMLYGIHIVLFCICMLVFFRNKRSTRWFILASVFIMFALSTAEVSITIRLVTHDIAIDPNYARKRFRPLVPLFVTNNFIAELVLLYRCYMIWGRSKYLLAATSFLVLVDTVWGLLVTKDLLVPNADIGSFFPRVYLWSVFAINILITGIAVGRIFWVAHISREFLDHHLLRRFHWVIAVLIESSAVYSACLLTFLIFPHKLVITIVTRVVTIMPTLLFVQLKLNDTVKDSNATDCDARPNSVILDTVVATIQEAPDPPRYNEYTGSRYAS